MRRIFPVLWMFALSCCIGVVMWYLWIFPGVCPAVRVSLSS